MATYNAEPATRRILFFTHAESGQANTILALALELLTRPRVQVHIASFSSLSSRVHGLSQAINFHALDGTNMFHRMQAQGISQGTLTHPPSRSWNVYSRVVVPMLTTWDGEEYMRVYEGCKEVIEEIRPDLVVSDVIFNPGLDACFMLNQKCVMNTPTPPTDVAKIVQPWLKGFWYYPAIATAIPFPVPWSLFLSNLWMNMGLIFAIGASTKVAELIKYRNERGIPGRLPLETPVSSALHIITSGIRELDYPLVVPDNLGLYGPLVLDHAPIEAADPELAQWLDRGKTVMMCMGTHFRYTESQVRAVVNGFLGALDQDPGVQFFWKFSEKDGYDDLVEELLVNPKDRERFKIVDWIQADLSVVLNHPNVIVSVHHGGANSYYEAAHAGIPQIILAQWLDLYDMATRAEYRGIGIFGNKSVAPDIDTVEFGAAVARLVKPGKESEEFRARARQIGEQCRKAGGKRAAVDKILEFTGDQSCKSRHRT